jgi:S-adenosylmethionine:tRNA ribosyltransferase-isomerase
MTAALRWHALTNEARPWSDTVPPIAFELPAELSATGPPEGRGLARDALRLMVSRVADDSIVHATFRDLPDFLTPGDLLVVNASATISAALDAWRRRSGRRLADKIALHLSSPLGVGARWVIELRRLTASGTRPLLDARVGEQLALAAGATATLVEPLVTRLSVAPRRGEVRLWVAELAVPDGVMAFATRYGHPIRYSYVNERWPLAYYQTVFATEPGSAEMPSAGRPFTREIVARLERKGVRVVPLVLHTGVASLESDEAPYPERYRVPAATAAAVNATRAAGGRVVAVGTTVVRALETVASVGGEVHAGEGWTDLVVTSERGVRVVNGMLTGFHEPRSSHLWMLEAVAGRRHVALAYQAALRSRYLWHEFGDVHFILADDGERVTP